MQPNSPPLHPNASAALPSAPTRPAAAERNRDWGDAGRQRSRDWAEPTADPILDAAQVPLDAFRANKPSRSAWSMYIWLHVLRPVVVALFWLLAAYYGWRHFFQPSDESDDVRLLVFYALIILGIFAIMLLLAPMRQRVRREEDSSILGEESTLFEIAEYAELPEGELGDWQSARSLVVHHDDHGRLRQAYQSSAMPLEAAEPPPPARSAPPR